MFGYVDIHEFKADFYYVLCILLFGKKNFNRVSDMLAGEHDDEDFNQSLSPWWRERLLRVIVIKCADEVRASKWQPKAKDE